MNKFHDVIGLKPGIPSRERSFEVRVQDTGTKAIYSYTAKVLHTDVTSDPKKVEAALREGFDRLMTSIFRPKLPEVSTDVVAASPPAPV